MRAVSVSGTAKALHWGINQPPIPEKVNDRCSLPSALHIPAPSHLRCTEFLCSKCLPPSPVSRRVWTPKGRPQEGQGPGLVWHGGLV